MVVRASSDRGLGRSSPGSVPVKSLLEVGFHTVSMVYPPGHVDLNSVLGLLSDERTIQRRTNGLVLGLLSEQTILGTETGFFLIELLSDQTIREWSDEGISRTQVR
jgi:hypothetical protein